MRNTKNDQGTFSQNEIKAKLLLIFFLIESVYKEKFSRQKNLT